MKGILAAMLTPLRADGSIDCSRLSSLANLLLREGCDGLVPFGTTGEFPSFTVRERKMALEAMVASGVPAGKIIAGTGACAVADMVELSRHAMDVGCIGALVGPPFYFKGLGEEAVYATYASFIEATGTDLRLYLYHFPDMSAVPIPFNVIRRLQQNFSEQLAGLKDSAGDFEYSRKLIDEFPTLAIFTGDDDLLLANLRAGGAGSITAGANLAVRELAYIRNHYLGHEQESVERKNQLLQSLWTGLLLKYPVTEALKEILATCSNSDDWLNMRLPLVRLSSEERTALIEGFQQLDVDVPTDVFGI